MTGDGVNDAPALRQAGIGVAMGAGPEWMATVGSLFPLKHLQNGLATAWGADPAVPWVNLLVLLAWGVGAALLTVRRFRWQPRQSWPQSLA